MPLENNPPDLPQVMAATGEKAFELAFVLAPNGGGCTPTWGGTAAVSSDTAVGNVINTVRSAGGDVSISIGGYGGTKLGQTCGTASATAAAYQQVIDKYSLKAVDFDLEEPEYENTSAINNEVGAAQLLQKNNPGLYVSITTAGTTSGTGYFGQNVLNTAKGLGFVPNNYSIMPFDGGFNGGGSQTAALEAFHTLLVNTFGWDSQTAYAHEGISMMNGKSDTGEMFSQADFQTVLDYVTGHGLSRYTFWAVNRDRPCGSTTDNGICSNISQNPWDFTKFDAKFAGATPPTTTPPTTTTTTPPGGGSCTAAAWNSATAYSGGAVVSYNGHQWTAKWWTQGDTPGSNSQNVWTDNGTCAGGPTTTTAPPGGGTCTVAAWNSATAYSGGAVVSYNGHKWTAKWWTQGDTPGSNSQNVWTDNGTC
ncbi:chitinase [Solihabitans fulvus]|uniref:Chitinase n=2 Tax=Solihabitans fulvus TaxID=1892852 RepID=A0A5B2XD41_9PSEU|nr:chitinase [Solihabitans fulvus]